MRFFKAFNILHRRTKSATFVPGPALDSVTSPSARNLNSSSSYNAHIQHEAVPSLSIFDMVTSQSSWTPPQFNHLADGPPSFWRPRRQSNRSSVPNKHQMDREHMQLKECIHFWMEEHSKLHSILTACHTELLVTRERNSTLERKTNLDAQIIKDLRSRLVQYSKISENTGLQANLPERVVQKTIISAPTIVDSSQTLSTTRKASTKAPTIEEYSNALRLTLATRKELRDQRKVTKFWKRRASLAVGKPQDLITPSVSAISSIHETLPAERKAALEALLIQRGLTSRLANVSSVEHTYIDVKTTQSPTETIVSGAVLPALAVSLSKSSMGSNLAPLASESMKAEISSMFGSRGSSRRTSLLSQKTRQSSSIVVALDSSKSSEIDINRSSSDFSIRLEGNKENTTQSIAQKHVYRGLQDAVSFEGSLIDGLSSVSSSFMHISALPSGSSEIFSECIAETTRSQNLSPDKVLQDYTIIQQPSMRQASKECTSRRSWQHYTLMKSNIGKRTTGEVVNSLIKRTPQPGSKDKENTRLSNTLPVFPHRRSRLPVPTLGTK